MTDNTGEAAMDRQLHDYYTRQSLSGRTLSQLTERIQNRSRVQRRRRVAYSLAAGLAAVALTLALGGRYWLMSDLRLNVAEEVVLNHVKALEPDFLSADYTELTTALSKLDFEIRPPQHALLSGASLVGARYCSLQGQLAVQLRYEGAEGLRFTLYQTPLAGRLARLTQVSKFSQNIDSVNVELWQQDGLLMGLAVSR